MYVYFVKAWGECPLIKIGKANNPEERVKRLQTGCPFKLKLLGAVRCKSEFHARQVEAMAHRLFRDQRRRGEWFKLSAKHVGQIESLIRRANAEAEARERAAEEGRALAEAERDWEREAWDRFE